MINYCLRKNELLIEKHKVLLWIMFTRGFKHMCGLRERKWLGVSDPSSETLQPRFGNGLEFKMASAAATTVWKTESVSFRLPNTVCGLLFFGLYQPLPDSWAVMCQWALKVYCVLLSRLHSDVLIYRLAVPTEFWLHSLVGSVNFVSLTLIVKSGYPRRDANIRIAMIRQSV